MAQAPYQNGLTILTPIREGQAEALAAVLEEINEAIPTHPDIAFDQLKRVHFIRWVVVPAAIDDLGRDRPAQLILSTNYDELLSAHLNELFDVGQAALHRIYEHCVDYPAPAQRSRGAVTAYLRSHDVGYDTLYVGTRGRTVTQIRGEADLRTAIQGFLDEQTRATPSFRTQSPGAIRSAIQSFVRTTPELAWAEEPPGTVPLRWPRPWDSIVAASVISLLVIVPALGWATGAGWRVLGIEGGLILLAAVAYLGWLRRREKRDAQDPPVTDYDHVAKLAQKEDRIVQNQMTSVTTVKAGWLRSATLYAVLWVIDLAGRYVYTSGKLGSIPSIHFARWVAINNGTQLVFFSNFDGSWENYLGDFIDKASGGLTAVWSNTFGFPTSRFLVGAGAKDEQRFKAYARNSQVLTDVWYSAYRDLSVQNINNNSAIRAGLFGPQTASETEAWLQRL